MKQQHYLQLLLFMAIASSTFSQTNYEDVVITRDRNDTRGLKKVCDLDATARIPFGGQSKLREKALEKIKQQAISKGANFVLIVIDNFSVKPINNVNIVGEGYKKVTTSALKNNHTVRQMDANSQSTNKNSNNRAGATNNNSQDVNSEINNSLLTPTQDCSVLLKENQYLRQVLNINTPINQEVSEGIEINIISVIGNKRLRSISIEVLINNPGPEIQKFHPSNDDYDPGGGLKIVDLTGEDYFMESAVSGSQRASNSWSFFTKTLPTSVPLRYTFSFKNVSPDVTIIKLFNLPFKYSYNQIVGCVRFQDIGVIWKN